MAGTVKKLQFSEGTAVGSPTDLGTSAGQDSSYDLRNYTITATVGSSALTVALKSKNGTDPTSSDAVSVAFRSTTAATGTYSIVNATAATSVVVSSGSTLGHTSAVATYFYIYAINNSGTVELAISTKLFDEGSVQTSTAEGGAGAADSASVLYSTTARTGKAIRLLARLLSTQSTAGTWAAVPTEISLGNNFITSARIGSVSGVAANTLELGEQITGSMSSPSLTTATAANAGSINLTPGTWDIRGQIYYGSLGASTICSLSRSSISSTSATVDFTNMSGGASSGAGLDFSNQVSRRVTITANTTYYLVAFLVFSVSTAAVTAGNGYLTATRVP